MSFQGSISELPVPDIIQLVSVSGKTGMFLLMRGAERGSIYLHNGRIVHARGYEVALYNNPEPIARIFGTGPWDLDALAGHMERSFGPLLGRQP